MLVGLVLNPFAGMGGSVGLKGTDGTEILEEARRRGAEPVSPSRASEALGELMPTSCDWIAIGGDMGGDLLTSLGIEHIDVDIDRRGDGTDTVRGCEALMAGGAELILFCGGDGTARDVMGAVGMTVPVIGIPSGVKMHSSVFANHPRDAGLLLRRHVENGLELREAEVMDIDEDEFRKGRLSAALYGHVMTPYEETLVQTSKSVFHGQSVEQEKSDIGRYFVEEIEEGCTFILGPGTTVAAITQEMGLEKTLLGVDVLKDGEFLVMDAREEDLLRILDEERDVGIVVTPIGSQGFIFGRGNQQISAEVLRRVDRGNLLVVSTPTKLRETEALRVDTGDADLDESFKGHIRVLMGYGLMRMVPVV